MYVLFVSVGMCMHAHMHDQVQACVAACLGVLECEHVCVCVCMTRIIAGMF